MNILKSIVIRMTRLFLQLLFIVMLFGTIFTVAKDAADSGFKWWYSFLSLPFVGMIIGWLLKKYVTQEAYDKLGKWIEKIGFGLGSLITLGMAKFIPGVWNSSLEPIFFIGLDTITTNFVAGVKRGCMTDNNSLKNGVGASRTSVKISG
ncbi:MAG: hypothetical protein ABII90_10250 [Bacteroidota bacterium]